MSGAINSVLDDRGSTSSVLPSLRRPHRRDTQARDGKHVVPFDELIAPHAQKVFRIAYRITRNREDAEDAMQEAFLQAFAHFDDFDGRSAFATWLTSIAINSSFMILRKRKTGRVVSLDAARNPEESKAFQQLRDPTPDAEQRCLQKEREAALQGAIKRLRPSLRGVVEVAQLGERSMRETAEIIGVSMGAAKARLFHARAALRKSRKLRRLGNERPSHKRSEVQAFRGNFKQSGRRADRPKQLEGKSQLSRGSSGIGLARLHLLKHLSRAVAQKLCESPNHGGKYASVPG